MIIKKVVNEILTTMNKKVEVKGKTVPKNWVGLAVFVVILLIMSIIFADAADQDTIDLNAAGGGFLVPKTQLTTGHSQENSESVEPITIADQNVIIINFTLTWRDEPDQDGRRNEPDQFAINVTTPWGARKETAMESNPHGGEGKVFLNFENPAKEKYNSMGTGVYNVTIKCGDCDEQWIIGPFPVIGTTDTGNDWELKVDHIYRVRGGNSRKTIVLKGHSNENSDTSLDDFSIRDENIAHINFTLLWKDEPDQSGRTNQPDEFSIEVTTPWEETQESDVAENPHGGEGSVALNFVNPAEKEKNTMGTGKYEVTIKCGNCGDQIIASGFDTEDDGNDWTLIIEYGYNVEFLEPDTFPVP